MFDFKAESTKKAVEESICCGRIRRVNQPWHIYLFITSVILIGDGMYWTACCCVEEDDKPGCAFSNLIAAFLMRAIPLFGPLSSYRAGCAIYWKGQ